MTKRLRNPMFAIMSSLVAVLTQPANSLSELAVITPVKSELHALKKNPLKTSKISTDSSPRKSGKLIAKSPQEKGQASSRKTVATKGMKLSMKKRNAATTKIALHKISKRIAKKLTPERPMAVAQKKAIRDSFANGYADKFSPRDMVRAGAFGYFPLRGGVFTRRSPIKAVVVHSTETASPASAKNIIRSWNNSGPNHAGTQFIVDRDGIIYLTVSDPIVGTFHVNSFITKEGVKNDNSIGIEIVRTGRQQYTPAQLASVSRLVHYLLDRYKIGEVYGHGEIQPADRTDPVGFDWKAFDEDIDGLEVSQAKHKAELVRIATAKKQESKLAALKNTQLPNNALLAAAKKPNLSEKQAPISANRKLQQVVDRLGNSEKKQTSEKANQRIVADEKRNSDKS